MHLQLWRQLRTSCHFAGEKILPHWLERCNPSIICSSTFTFHFLSMICAVAKGARGHAIPATKRAATRAKRIERTQRVAIDDRCAVSLMFTSKVYSVSTVECSRNVRKEFPSLVVRKCLTRDAERSPSSLPVLAARPPLCFCFFWFFLLGRGDGNDSRVRTKVHPAHQKYRRNHVRIEFGISTLLQLSH